MTTKELAKQLVHALAMNCKGINHDYNMQEVEHLFDRVLKEAGDGMKQSHFRPVEHPH